METEKATIEQLLQRVEKLEKRMIDLERIVSARPTRTNGTINQKMEIACYQAARQAYENEKLIVAHLAEKISCKYNMKKSTANLTILSAYALLRGELFKSTISGKAAELFLSQIRQDFGEPGLHRAVLALRLHIKHRRAAGHNVNLLEMICNRHERP